MSHEMRNIIIIVVSLLSICINISSMIISDRSLKIAKKANREAEERLNKLLFKLK